MIQLPQLGLHSEKGDGNMREDITIRSETPKDYKDIVSMVLRSFQEGTDYSDGTDIVALIEEIRMSKYYTFQIRYSHSFCFVP